MELIQFNKNGGPVTIDIINQWCKHLELRVCR